MEAETTVRRGPGRPPTKPHEGQTPDKAPQTGYVGRRVESVRFHTGVQFLAEVKTGLSAEKDKADITMINPTGTVLVSMRGHEWVIPGGTINYLKLVPV